MIEPMGLADIQRLNEEEPFTAVQVDGGWAARLLVTDDDDDDVVDTQYFFFSAKEDIDLFLAMISGGLH